MGFIGSAIVKNLLQNSSLRITVIDSLTYAGNLKNLTEGNGYVVYNISDKITMKTGLNATYYFNPKMSLGFRYDLLKRESSYDRYYSTFNAAKVKVYSDKYVNNSFILSLLWKF